MSEKRSYNFKYKFPTILFALPTAMVGYHIHGSIFWAIMDFIFWPLALIKWAICQEITLTIIKETFSWFLV
jgi:hypothetical protein|tara:strand:- start:2040 stop:2252 length:213 start_codon:yes stop_codon:yes gene_type:complete